jgi:hypothetical protein
LKWPRVGTAGSHTMRISRRRASGRLFRRGMCTRGRTFR